MEIIIIAIVLLVVLWFIRNKTKKPLEQRTSEETSKEEICKFWREKRIPTNECEVKEVPAFYDWKTLDDTPFESDFGKAVLVYRAMATKALLSENKEDIILTRLRCFDKSTTPIEVYEVNFADVELDILQAKLNVQGYINVYYNPQNPKEVYIDTEFLQKDLTELMNV